MQAGKNEYKALRIAVVFASVMMLIILSLYSALVVFASESSSSSNDITLHYEYEDKTFPNLTVELYTIAEADNGYFGLKSVITDNNIDTDALKIENYYDANKRSVFKTSVESYITADDLEPDYTAKTDSDGNARFTDLPDGVYLVKQVTYQDSKSSYRFDSVLVSLPEVDADEDTSSETVFRDVTAEPKAEISDVTEESELSVRKVWKDNNRSDRPDSVEIEIYHDGELDTDLVLDDSNDWEYTWDIDDTPADWTVKEKSPGSSYTVKIERSSDEFIVTNTLKGGSSNSSSSSTTYYSGSATSVSAGSSVQTGDNSNMLLWILILSASTAVMIAVVVIAISRKHACSKKK